MAGTQQIWAEQGKHLLRQKCFLMHPGDDKAKLLGYCGYKMKAVFQLWDSISSVVSWHNYLDINKTHDWTLNSLVEIHREQKLQNSVRSAYECSYLAFRALVLSESLCIDLKGHWPRRLCFPHLFSVAKCTKTSMSVYCTRTMWLVVFWTQLVALSNV